MITTGLTPRIEETLRVIKLISRVSLGLVWLYEGLVPKIFFLRANPEQIELVWRSRIFWPTPRVTLIALGIAQAVVGTVLMIGWEERAAVLLSTIWMLGLIVLVAKGKPGMLTDPYGALVKDFCLISCAVTVWMLAPIV